MRYARLVPYLVNNILSFPKKKLTPYLDLCSTDPTYQVDPTTRICGPVEAAPIAISYITDYYFSNANPYVCFDMCFQTTTHSNATHTLSN